MFLYQQQVQQSQNLLSLQHKNRLHRGAIPHHLKPMLRRDLQCHLSSSRRMSGSKDHLTKTMVLSRLAMHEQCPGQQTPTIQMLQAESVALRRLLQTSSTMRRLARAYEVLARILFLAVTLHLSPYLSRRRVVCLIHTGSSRPMWLLMTMTGIKMTHRSKSPPLV